MIISKDFVGGNIEVVDRKGNDVYLKNELRDTQGDWFYWAFCVENAAGESVTFHFGRDRLGYFGKAYHNNDYTFYERQETHNNLGYSEGFMGMGNGMEEYVADVWPESDEEMLKGTLQEYIDHSDDFPVIANNVRSFCDCEMEKLKAAREAMKNELY